MILTDEIKEPISKPLKEDQIKKFYNIFQPNFVQVFINEGKNDDMKLNPYKSFFINKYEDMLNICKNYNNSNYTIYSCYRKLKPNVISRNQNDVIFHRYFFVDVDIPEEEIKVEDLISKNNIKYTFKVKSGRGFHYYFQTQDLSIFNDDFREIERLKTASTLFIDWFIDNDVKVDRAIKDLARLTRIFGTYNYKRDNYCEVLIEKTLTKEELDYNNKFIFELKPKYNIEFKSPHTRCSNCKFIEKCFNHNFEAENHDANIDLVLLKNVAAYLYENQRNYNEARLICLIQGHKETEIEGWWKKAKDGFKFNCLEMRKFIKEFFPNHFRESCLFCMIENKNKVLYLNDETLDFTKLKEEYRDSNKFPINRYYRLRGSITQTDNIYKCGYVIAKKYLKELEEFIDNKELTIEELQLNKSYIIIYFDEKDLTKEEIKKLRLKLIENIDIDFFVYKMIINEKEFKLFSEVQLESGEAIVEGNILILKDKKKLGEDRKETVMIPYLFAHNVQTSLSNYESWDKVFENFNYTEQEINDYIFYKKDGEDEKYILDYPELFKWLIKAFLFSGKRHTYPLHLVIVGPQGTGKSWLLISLIQKYGNDCNMIGGGSTTIKAFIPSCPGGKYNKGLLYNANLLLGIDELFNIFIKESNEEDGATHIQKFNNILENLPMKTGSAYGTHKEELKAKTISVTNPIDKSHINFEKSINIFPSSSVQRFLFFNMGSKFVDFLRNNIVKEIKDEPSINNNKWLMLMKFMMSDISKIEYDRKKIIDIASDKKRLCPESLLHLYETRLTTHHAILVFDGLVKWRILFEKDKKLQVKEEDYLLFEQLWEYIINSWKSNGDNILTKNENILLDLIPEEGINRETLKRRAEKIFGINEEATKIVTNMIKDLRNYGFVENGKKDDMDRQNIYRVKEKEISLNDIKDDGQLRLDDL